MRGHFATWCSPPTICRGLAPGWIGYFLAAWPALVCCARAADSLVPRGQAQPTAQAPVDAAPAPSAIADVILHDGGILRGEVLAESLGPAGPKRVHGARVVLVSHGLVVAETVSDRQGRFALSHLRGGTYVISATGRDGAGCGVCRAWTAGGAPARAGSALRIVVAPGLVLGQGPLPALSFSDAALTGGLIVGAVAAPVVYHNAQKSNRVPASP
ncbi:MAG: hypothetical protein ACYC6Y_21370 [Thermoguttaceae bacterium]